MRELVNAADYSMARRRQTAEGKLCYNRDLVVRKEVGPAAMDEMFILLLKYLLYLVMIGATVAIFGEIVPMARGKTARRPPSSNNVEE